MPSFLTTCTALLGAVAVAQAVPSRASAPLFSNSSSPLSSSSNGGQQQQQQQSCVLGKCSSSIRHGTAGLLATLAPASLVQGQNKNSSAGSSASRINSNHQEFTLTTSTTFTSISRVSQTQSSSSTATVSSSPTSEVLQATLLPDIHWTFDTKPAENVKPVPAGEPSKMFYGNSDPSQSGHFAFVSYNFTRPFVNLDHSDHVTVSSAKPDRLAVDFHSQEAFEHASQTWSVKEGLVLIAYANACEGHEQGQRCYFDVSSLELPASSAGARTIVARGEAKHPDDLSSGGETQWGWWEPAGKSGAASSASDGSGLSAASGSGSSSGQGHDCVAPPDFKNGLATACPGKDFDANLDASLGHEPLSNKMRAMVNSVAPWLNLEPSRQTSAQGSNGTSAVLTRRHQRDTMAKRWTFLPFMFSSTISATGQVLANKFSEAVESVHFGGDIERQFSWSLPEHAFTEGEKAVDGEGNEISSPWKNARLLKSLGGADVANPEASPTPEAEEKTPEAEKIQDAEYTPEPTTPEAAAKPTTILNKHLSQHLNLYCVDCGTRGKATVSGHAQWSLTHGITAGKVEVNTDMFFGLKVGVDAQLRGKLDYSTELLRKGLPGLSYGSVTIAPQVSVEVRVGLEAAAKGRLLAGGEVVLQASRVVVDLIDGASNSQKNVWEAHFKPVLEAEGEVLLGASLALPVGFECGLAISKWHKTVSLIEEPSIKASAQAAVAMSLPQAGSFSAGFKEHDGCTGISTRIAWRNRAFINVFDMKEYPVHDTESVALPGICIALPAHKTAEQQLANATQDDTKSKRSSVLAPSPLNSNWYTGVDGLNYTDLATTSRKTVVLSCGDGNLRVSLAHGAGLNPGCSSLFPLGADQAIVSDSSRRLMHYDALPMSRLGVSRLRLRAASDDVTRSGVVVALRLYTNASTRFYLAVDANGNVLTPVVCEYRDGSAPKVFLVKDAEQGLAVLEGEEVRSSVTGGLVDRCQPLMVS